MLGYIVEELVFKKKFNEAKGILLRNNLGKDHIREDIL